MQAELSIWRLISDASAFVQFIMLILFLMFLVTLFISGKKWQQFHRIDKKIKAFDQYFWNPEAALQSIYAHYEKRDTESIENVFVNGFYEFNQFGEADLNNPDMIVYNCSRAMEATILREASKQERYLGVLATIGSSAPYIGLLGTVFGIMNSFMALGNAQQTSINSVAPGIAEALVATGMGLFAAIPSVLAYNYFIARSEKQMTEYDAFREEFCNLLQRQILHLRAHLNRR